MEFDNERKRSSDVTLEMLQKAFKDVGLPFAVTEDYKNGIRFSVGGDATPENIPLMIEATIQAHRAAGHVADWNGRGGMHCECWD